MALVSSSAEGLLQARKSQRRRTKNELDLFESTPLHEARFASSKRRAKTLVSISHLADRSLSTKGKAEYELQIGKRKGNRQKERVESNKKESSKGFETSCTSIGNTERARGSLQSSCGSERVPGRKRDRLCVIVDVEQLLRNVTSRRGDREKVLLEPTISHDEESFVSSDGSPVYSSSISHLTREG